MKDDVFDMPVFAAADVFPMMTDGELQELAADIKENGLKDPLVIAEIADVEGEIHQALIDGRNRRAACKIAGVRPATIKLNGEDPTAFVISKNIHRRNMTKGQRAMVVAVLYPDPEKGGRGKKSEAKTSAKIGGFSMDLIDRARVIVAYAKDHIQDVLSGAMPLDEAYKVAQDRKDADASQEAQLEKLRVLNTELADKVTEGELSLKAAFVEASERENSWRERRNTAIRFVKDSLFNVGAYSAPAHVKSALELLEKSNDVKELLKNYSDDVGKLKEEFAKFKKGVPEFTKLIAAIIGALDEQSKK